MHAPGKSSTRRSQLQSTIIITSVLEAIQITPTVYKDDVDDAVVTTANSQSSSAAALRAVTWERLWKATPTDPLLQDLGGGGGQGVITPGFSKTIEGLPESLSPFWQHREAKIQADGVS